MSVNFDVVIIGAGPAGLRCAEVLSKSELSVIVLEKKSVAGPKVCAGGITAKDLRLLNIPDSIFEKTINKARLYSPHFTCNTDLGVPVVYMVNRADFGQWQLSLINSRNVTVRTNAKVTSVTGEYVEVNGNERIKYKYLVGADGAVSVVRRYLKLPVEKRLATFQYRIPVDNPPDRIEIYMHSRYFKAWYAWVFPHEKELVVGCGANPGIYPPKKLKQQFHRWLNKQGFDVSKAKYESFPISYDYRGYRFGNRFLAGEAAGLASGLTGEGIFQALVSGEEVAKTIIDPDYHSEAMDDLLRYNKIQHRVLAFLLKAGIFRNLVFDLIVWLMHLKPVNRYITKGFSGAG